MGTWLYGVFIQQSAPAFSSEEVKLSNFLNVENRFTSNIGTCYTIQKIDLLDMSFVGDSTYRLS